MNTSFLSKLEDIYERSECLGRLIRKETAVCSRELEERNRLGLVGHDAILHYNAWMKRYGLEHLIVDL